jgi:uncharacterized protein YbaR (Trm112 family)
VVYGKQYVPAHIDRDDIPNALCCPHCKGNYLHQRTVLVYDRQEDAERVRRTIVTSGAVSSTDIDNNSSGNPSSRRHAVTIFFECEFCQRDDLKLHFIQHKGNTFVQWSDPDGIDS